jgi:uncharacterized Zn finger protein
MTEVTITKFIGNTINYQCPYCGEINTYYESTVEMLKENGKTFIECDGCDNKIII